MRHIAIALLRRGTPMVAALAWIDAGAAAAGPVSGTVTVITASGAASSWVVVHAAPLDVAAPRRSGRFTLAQKDRTFVPAILAVPVGSTVDFPNGDLIFHNVFSLSPPQPFDLGLYRGGASRSVTFTRPGTYRVFCNIHPEMSASILVVSSPWIARVDDEGRYTLDLPAGRFRITAQTDRASPASAEVDVGPGPTQVPPLTLDESRFVRVPHKNKYGQEYPAAVYDRKP